MIKGFRQIASITAASRVFGLVRDIAYSYFFGANQLLDAWIIAFRIPNLSRRLFGEGAASASFIPVYSQALHKDRRNAAALANTVLTVLFMILAGLVLAGEAGIWLYYTFFAKTDETRLILSLSSIMLPYMLFVCIVAMLAGLLNVHKHFAAPAAAPIVLNIFIIGTILLTGWAFKLAPRQQLFCIAVAVLIAGVVQIAIQMPPLKSSGHRLRPAWQVRSEHFKKILILMGPMILGLTVTQLNTLADDVIAWLFSGSEEKGRFLQFLGSQIQYPMWRGSVSHLYYSQRLYQLPLGVLGISLATAIFPVMSADAAREDLAALRLTISKGIRAAIFVAIPATVGIILVSDYLVAAIFQHGQFTPADTRATALTLTFYALGLTGYFSQQVTARAFYSLQDSTTPMRSAVIAVAANVVLNLTLIWFIGTAGLALSTAICSYLQVAILLRALSKRLGKSMFRAYARTFLKTALATLIMGLIAAAILYFCRNLPRTTGFDILRLTIVVPASIATYSLAAKMLRIEMLSLITGRKPAK